MSSEVNLDDCWHFAGNLNSKGYGNIFEYINGRTRRWPAHRVMWENMRDEVPSELVVDHLCRVPQCINPIHLEPVTNAENLRRARGNKEGFCIRGHELTPDNVFIGNFAKWSKPRRTCRTCSNNRRRIKHEKARQERQGNNE